MNQIKLKLRIIQCNKEVLFPNVRDWQKPKPKAYARIKGYQGAHYHTEDFKDVEEFLKWKWRVDECEICDKARPRLDRYKNITEDINERWLDSGKRIKCCRMYSRDKNSTEISKEL
jgi:hypothetical protein